MGTHYTGRSGGPRYPCPSLFVALSPLFSFSCALQGRVCAAYSLGRPVLLYRPPRCQRIGKRVTIDWVGACAEQPSNLHHCTCYLCGLVVVAASMPFNMCIRPLKDTSVQMLSPTACMEVALLHRLGLCMTSCA